MQKTKPYLDNSDFLSQYYHQVSDKDIQSVNDTIHNLIANTPTFKTPINDDYHHLLDFANIHAKCQFELFEKICHCLNGDTLTWFVFGGDNPYLFNEFDPPMIAKTPNQVSMLQKVSVSFMQMQNGAYVVFDDNRQFYAIIVDGYYMVCLLHKSIHIEQLEHYLKNWQKIETRLDSTTAQSLISISQ